jgi:hypothetical protein
MADTGMALPSTVASVSEAGYSNNAWQNPDNVKADDGAGSGWTTDNSFDNPDKSYVLRCTNFGFAVPAGATIDGILVTLEWRDTTGIYDPIEDILIQLTKDGASRVGNNLAEYGNPTYSWSTTTRGAVDALWGTKWTPSEVNASTFGVHLAVAPLGTNGHYLVDYVGLTIYYTEGGGPAGRVARQVMFI